MSDIILKGKVVHSGFFKGEAIVSHGGFGFYRAIDPVTGIVRDKRNELFGQNIAGKVLVFPEGRGSTSGAMMIAELARRGTHFKAMVNRKTESILAAGIIMAEKFFGEVIPAIHDFEIDPMELIRTGDIITVNGNTGELIVGK
jgi:uncharacterized protein